MKYQTNLPTTLISHCDSFGNLIHFGKTDINGILEVSDNNKFIGYLKTTFKPIENDKPLDRQTIGVEIKSNTTPISGDTDKKEGVSNVNISSASNDNGTSTKRTRTTKSDKNNNGKKRSGRSPNKTRSRNADTDKNKNSATNS